MSEIKSVNLSAKQRLENICRALEEQADESPFTREEWERVDAEAVRLQAQVKQLRAAIIWVTRDAAYKAPEQINAEMVDRWMSHLLDAVGFSAETKPPELNLGPSTEWRRYRYWEREAGPGLVTCNSRVVGGVLCRWWGDGAVPEGVALIDAALQGETFLNDAPTVRPAVAQVTTAVAAAVNEGAIPSGAAKLEPFCPHCENGVPVAQVGNVVFHLSDKHGSIRCRRAHNQNLKQD